MDFNYNTFYILGLNIPLIDYILYDKKYYYTIFSVFSNIISFEDFKSKLIIIFDNESKINSEIYKICLLKTFKYIILNHSLDINIDNSIINENHVDDFIYEMENNITLTNDLLYGIYSKILNDKDKIIYYYYKYFENIFENLDTKSYQIEINVLDKNKLEIIEGTHRFIFCYIKKIKPYFIIKESNYGIFNNIMDILNNDYENMYKKENPNFIIYNKIPHTIFSNFEMIREDRSKYIIDFLKKYNYKNGLEIGPQNGLLSIELAKENYNMVCIEYEKKYFDLTKNIIELCDVTNSCKVLYNDITKCYRDIKDNNFDFIVSLSVFYHLKRNNPDLFENIFIELIKSTKILIFDDEIKTNILTIDDIKKYINKINNIDIDIKVVYKGVDLRTIYALIIK
jgi:predicted O-methyltransferase YrrM